MALIAGQAVYRMRVHHNPTKSNPLQAMSFIRIRDHQFDADAVVFDKDGTLIDFHRLWGARAESAIRTLLTAVGYDDTIEQELCRTLGFDIATRRTHGTGPMATAPIRKLNLVAATVLYQNGMPWDRSETMAVAHFGPALSAPVGLHDLEPRGDVIRLFESMSAARLRIGIATTDDRHSTESALRLLQLARHVDLLLCGDDTENPVKPQAAVIQWITDRFGTVAERTIVVSDTATDLIMAREARTGKVVGILGGAGDRAELEPLADVLIESLDEITVPCC